ncbi:hypothetical protein APUTEX25_003348, partial [Auxenochlorella protothecoides]
MAMGMPYGMQSMLKDGHKIMSGLEEAVLRNIEACKGLTQITRTSLGPNGMNKVVINHLDKLFVTSDASTIAGELEIQHPAARLIVLAAQAQHAEVGDGCNFVLTFAGELLGHAEALLRDGLHPVEIADGYAKAGKAALAALESLVVPGSVDLDLTSADAVARRLLGPLSSKQYGVEATLAALVARACVAVLPPNPANFAVDNVRVVKIRGGTLSDSYVERGLVLRRGVEGRVASAANARVAVYAQGFDTSSTETKGTVLIRSAGELEGYAKGEEAKLEQVVKAVADSGATVVVSGGNFGEMALHFLDKYGLMAVKVPSKFDLRRVCRATGAVALMGTAAPTAAELGHAGCVELREVGSTPAVLFGGQASRAGIATIVLRGATDQLLDDVERAETGLDQYAIARFADALEVVPRTLAESSGLPAEESLAALHAAHAAGQARAGLDVETGAPRDLGEDGHLDLFAARWWGLRLAVEAATTVLRVDQIIMAKTAGGPKPRQGAGDDD